MADVEWMDGLRIFPPNDKAPDFVKGDIVIEPERAIAWLKKQDGTVRLELKTKKSDGSLYATVKQKRPRNQDPRNQTNAQWLDQYGNEKPLPRASFPPNFTEDYEDDIPF